MSFDSDPSINVSIGHIISAIFAGIASIAVWLLQKLGVRHINSMDNLAKEIKELRYDISKVDGRVAILEYVNKMRVEHQEKLDK